uniref:Uncharacterized protein n=1 Tax=Meloidogyne javanica TaxID=6303 RepID=A0A915N5R0_MELJA
MIKFLIIICLILKTHSWTWEDYPSPRGTTFWKCGVTKPTYVCDPDGMLTDQQRQEIVELVEDFKEKTKRPNALYQCRRDGLRLVVALAKNKIGPDTVTSNITLCTNDRSWTSLDITDCKTDMIGIELNTYGFRYCYQLRTILVINEDEFGKLNNNENRTFVCDPDGMLTDQQRKEIVELVEDFKEKTKRPLSTIPCMEEGLRLVVALAIDKIGPEDGSNGLTYLCKNERNWTSSYKTTCDSDVQGIELNTDGFRYCYSASNWLMPLHVDEYEWLGRESKLQVMYPGR